MGGRGGGVAGQGVGARVDYTSIHLQRCSTTTSLMNYVEPTDCTTNEMPQ